MKKKSFVLSKIEQKKKEKSLNISIAEGSAFSVMEGFGLRYITPYAIALNMSNFLIGILSSLPALVGSLSQIPGSRAVERYSRKKIIFVSVLLQALTWLPIILVGYLYFFVGITVQSASLLLIVFYTFLVLSGAFAGPAWSSWMKDLLARQSTDSYFGKRSSIAGTIGLISAFAAGMILTYYKKNTFLGFTIIFSIAFIGRLLSAYFFTKKYEPKLESKKETYFNFVQFVRKVSSNNFGRFVIFSTLISFSTAVASPFFSVYLLRDLQASYTFYTILIVVPVILTLISLPFWGKFGDKYGNVAMLRICGSLIFLIPLLWVFSPLLKQNYYFLLFYLIIVEIFSGFVWAGLNLSTGTFVFYAVTKERLPLCVAYSGILNSFGAFLGATAGGVIASSKEPILGIAPILFVFLLSAGLRIFSFSIMISKVKEVREVKNFEIKKLRLILTRLWPKHTLQNSGVKRTGHAPFGAH